QVREAQAKADALQADAERKHTEIMATINQQRGVLESRIDQLRTFEKDYRSRLTSYLENQLSELGKTGSAAPAASSASTSSAGGDVPGAPGSSDQAAKKDGGHRAE